MSGSGAGPLVPTFHGFVSNSMDGLMLFEACLSGKLHHVPRRPHDRERAQLIKSGSIFIYEENASGIKRWTDGVAWSPSRILGNFLIYRELEKPFPPGEKKRAMKRKRESFTGDSYPRRESDVNTTSTQITPITPPTPPAASSEVKSETASSEADKDMERALIGSLVDSYGFRPDGLVKKTMSISINGISHHMVSYYNVADVKNNVLPRPQSDTRLQGIPIRPELYLKQNFRSPIEEIEHYAIDGNMHAHPQMLYSMPGGPYAARPSQYYGQQQQQYQPMYAMPHPPPSAYNTASSHPGPTSYNAASPHPASTSYNTASPHSAPPSYNAAVSASGSYSSAVPHAPSSYSAPLPQVSSSYAAPHASTSYSTPGASWPPQQSAGPVSYGSSPSYNSQSYANYYKPQATKNESEQSSSQSMPYAGQYAQYPVQPSHALGTTGWMGRSYGGTQ